MNQKTATKNQSRHTVNVPVNIELLDFLCMDVSHPIKYTRLQAFSDLLRCQAIATSTGVKTINNFSFQHFSKRWNWHRDTVRKFFAELVKFKVVLIVSEKDNPNKKILVLKTL
jgi:hypothetical protein